MKKTLWGYNIQEVDETISYLETQNVKLERQVKQLSTELDNVKKELEEASAVSEISQNTEKDDLIAELRQKLETEENQNRELTLQNETLSNQINEISAEAAAKDPFEKIGVICKQAYTDIHTSKQKAKESLEGFLKEFWDEWKNYEIQLTELSDKLAVKQQKSRESFISYADYILKVYGDIEDSNNSFETQFSEIVKSKSKIECSLNAILAELDKDVEMEDNLEMETENHFEQDVEKDVEDEPKSSILSAIQKLNESKAADDSQRKSNEHETENQNAETTAFKSNIFERGKDEINISQKVNIRNII